MGVLDDAIREHIELKRKHGAREEELRLQEQEALGPARRESPAPPAAAQEDADAHQSATAAGLTEVQSPRHVEDLPHVEGVTEVEGPAGGEGLAPAEGLAAEEGVLPAEDLAAEGGILPAEDLAGEEGLSDVEDVTEVAAADPPWGMPTDWADGASATTDSTAEDVVSGEGLPESTAFRDSAVPPESEPLDEDDLFVEGEPFSEEPDEDDEITDGEDEDVLEETPEFLQETPEHDRLWFEQKPPRDFDFDE